MEKNILKKVILENQEFIGTIHPYNRDYRIEKNANYVIVGARRAGKTWYLFSIIQKLIKEKRNLNRIDRKSTRLNSSHTDISRMPSSA